MHVVLHLVKALLLFSSEKTGDQLAGQRECTVITTSLQVSGRMGAGPPAKPDLVHDPFCL
jgi:hypothetical protein